LMRSLPAKKTKYLAQPVASQMAAGKQGTEHERQTNVLTTRRTVWKKPGF
jgi:hypothetical protein